MAPLARQITVRLSAELVDAVERDSKENGRTPGQTVRFRLEQYYGIRDGD